MQICKTKKKNVNSLLPLCRSVVVGSELGKSMVQNERPDVGAAYLELGELLELSNTVSRALQYLATIN